MYACGVMGDELASDAAAAADNGDESNGVDPSGPLMADRKEVSPAELIDPTPPKEVDRVVLLACCCC